MDINEIDKVIKVWIIAFLSLIYCYFIPRNIPIGKFRFVSLLPAFYLLSVVPFSLTTSIIGGNGKGPLSSNPSISLKNFISVAYLTWLGNLKLLLLAFGKGPLSSDPSISLKNFIFVACLPIKIKSKDSPESTSAKISPTSHLNLALKGLLLVLLSLVYQHKHEIHPKIMLIYFCLCVYLGLEVVQELVSVFVSLVLGFELEPQFNEPYLSTSLQDFWGRRWNLMVMNALRSTIYEPVTCISTRILGKRYAPLPSIFATFLVSGLMHEMVFYYQGRVSPTWEVTCFFVLHGICLPIEILVKKAVNNRWRLHPVVSRFLTIGFVMVTSSWLFFPQLFRCELDVKSSREVAAFVELAKDIGRRALTLRSNSTSIS